MDKTRKRVIFSQPSNPHAIGKLGVFLKFPDRKTHQIGFPASARSYEQGMVLVSGRHAAG